MATSTRNAFAFFVATVLAIASVSEAKALDAYWHGVRSNIWSDGISGGQSNWYSAAPPSGSARDVPDDTAYFAAGALQPTIYVDDKRAIGTIIYTSDAPPYLISLLTNKVLSIDGFGITNASASEQTFNVPGKKTRLEFLNSAVACKKPGGDVVIDTYIGGAVWFNDKSKIGKGCKIDAQGGNAFFDDKSSAGKGDLSVSQRGQIAFRGRSTGGDADITVLDGELTFDSAGPRGNSALTAGSLDVVEGKVDLGVDKVAVKRDSTFVTGSHLAIKVNSKKAFGSLYGKGLVYIAGVLEVTGTTNATAGSYKLIRSRRPIAGKFDKVKLKRFGSSRPKIKYTRKSVVLVIPKK
jgi:hypothetical protein